MNLMRFASIALVIGCVPGLEPQAATHRFGVIIGNNRGRDSSKELRYAEQDAQKLHRALIDQGGFSDQNLRLVLAKSAAYAWSQLLAVERQVEDTVGQNADSSLFVVFYSGHADGEVLEMGNTSLHFRDLKKFLEGSCAKVRLAFVDSCHSGMLVANKAGKRVEGFKIDVTNELASSGYAIITSSAEDELSQESEEIRGSFFTHYLVSALRGAGDQSGDGLVTLNEAYQYAYSRTVARTSQMVGGGQHPMYDFHLSGRGEIVLARAEDNHPGVYVDPLYSGRLVIINETREQLIAEANVDTGRTFRLGIQPGRYLAYSLSKDGVHQAAFEVSAGKPTHVKPDDFSAVQLERAVKKGGLFRRRWSHRVDLGFALRSWPLSGKPFSYGSALQYRADGPIGVSPTVRLLGTLAPNDGASTGYFDLGVLVGVGRLFRFDALSIRAELLAGYEYLRQNPRDFDSRYSSGLGYLTLISLSRHVGPLDLAFSGGVGGRLFRLRKTGWVHRFDWQLSFGLGWSYDPDEL